MRSQTYCVGVDWIEFTATLDLDGLPEYPFLFSHEHTGHGSKYYLEMYNIDTVYHGETLPFAQLHMKSRVSFIDKNVVQVKIDNRFCYTPDIVTTIQAFCREYGLTFKNITRLDVFADFQEISGYGKDIQRFLGDCRDNKLVIKGKSKKTHELRSEVTGITWGVRTSGVAATWYNKTTEMLKKSWKPWIEQLWREAGFDVDNHDVYRLEFSMKKGKADIVTEDGETLSLNHDLTMLNKTKQIFDYCYHMHFQMAVNQTGQRFSRLMRYYPINMDATPYYSSMPCIKPKSTNYTKAFIKRLVFDALFYQKKGKALEASFAYDHIIEVVGRYSLWKWFDSKFHWVNLRKANVSVFDIFCSSNDLAEAMKQRPLNVSSLALNRELQMSINFQSPYTGN